MYLSPIWILIFSINSGEISIPSIIAEIAFEGSIFVKELLSISSGVWISDSGSLVGVIIFWEFGWVSIWFDTLTAGFFDHNAWQHNSNSLWLGVD